MPNEALPQQPKPERKFLKPKPKQPKVFRSSKVDSAKIAVENDPGVLAARNMGTEGVRDVQDRTETAYRRILESTRATINQDPSIAAADATSNPGEMNAAREQAATNGWGRFAEQNPETANKFASENPEIKAAITRYIDERTLDANRAIGARITELVNNDPGVTAAMNSGNDAEVNDRRKIAETRIASQVWTEYASYHPDTVRLLAEAGNRNFQTAYENLVAWQEANKSFFAQRAAEAVKNGGTDAGLATIAEGMGGPEPNIDGGGPKPVWRGIANKEPNVAPQQPPAEGARTTTQRTETTAPSTETLPPKEDTPTGDRLLDAVTAKVAADRAFAAAENSGIPKEEIDRLNAARTIAEAEYQSALADRDQAILAGRLSTVEQTLQGIQARLDAPRPEPTPQAENLTNSQLDHVNEAAGLLSDAMKETDPEKQKALWSEIAELLTGVILTSAGDQAQHAAKEATEAPL